jgi:mercuric ion binding protein
MKTSKIIIIAFIAFVFNSNSFAQLHDHSKMDMSGAKTASKMDMANTKTVSLKVWGNCDLCKARIEKAVNVDGVSKANWDSKTKMLSLVYDPSKTNSDELQKKIAAVGHDTEKFKADDKAYAKLPGCCQYDRKN